MAKTLYGHALYGQRRPATCDFRCFGKYPEKYTRKFLKLQGCKQNNTNHIFPRKFFSEIPHKTVNIVKEERISLDKPIKTNVGKHSNRRR